MVFPAQAQHPQTCLFPPAAWALRAAMGLEGCPRPELLTLPFPPHTQEASQIDQFLFQRHQNHLLLSNLLSPQSLYPSLALLGACKSLPPGLLVFTALPTLMPHSSQNKSFCLPPALVEYRPSSVCPWDPVLILALSSPIFGPVLQHANAEPSSSPGSATAQPHGLGKLLDLAMPDLPHSHM